MALFHLPARKETRAPRGARMVTQPSQFLETIKKDRRRGVAERPGYPSEWCATSASTVAHLAHSCCSSVKSQKGDGRG